MIKDLMKPENLEAGSKLLEDIAKEHFKGRSEKDLNELSQKVTMICLILASTRLTQDEDLPEVLRCAATSIEGMNNLADILIKTENAPTI